MTQVGLTAPPQLMEPLLWDNGGPVFHLAGTSPCAFPAGGRKSVWDVLGTVVPWSPSLRCLLVVTRPLLQNAMNLLYPVSQIALLSLMDYHNFFLLDREKSHSVYLHPTHKPTGIRDSSPT